jgi:hypothetical protein
MRKPLLFDGSEASGGRIFLPGQVLFKTNGYISEPRISPDGNSVAFLEHPVFADNRGYVDVADANGKVRRLSPENAGEQGLAWSPDGRELWYAASPPGVQEHQIFAVSLNGNIRKVMQIPNNALSAISRRMAGSCSRARLRRVNRWSFRLPRRSHGMSARWDMESRANSRLMGGQSPSPKAVQAQAGIISSFIASWTNPLR